MGRSLLRIGARLERCTGKGTRSARYIRSTLILALGFAAVAWSDLAILPRREVLTPRFVGAFLCTAVLLYAADALAVYGWARLRGVHPAKGRT